MDTDWQALELVVQVARDTARRCRVPGEPEFEALSKKLDCQVLKRLANICMPNGVPNLEGPAPLLPLEHLSKTFASHGQAVWQQLSRSPRQIADSDHASIKLCTYARWFDARTVHIFFPVNTPCC